MRRLRNRWRLLAPIALTVLALALGACGDDDGNGNGGGSATASGDQPSVGNEQQVSEWVQRWIGREYDVDKLSPIVAESLKVAAAPITPELKAKLLECMDKPICDTGTGGDITVGIFSFTAADLGNLDNRASFTLQALRYPQVGKIIHVNANGDAAAAVSNFRSLVSQKADIIVGNYSAGAALLPVAKQATQSGVKVVEYTQHIPGAVKGKDVLTFLGVDICQYGKDIADKAIEAAGGGASGNVALFTGIPGNPFAGEWQPCTKEQLESKGWKVAHEGNTNWNPQGEQQAAAALIASGKDIDAIIYDYTPQAMVRGYLNRNKRPPAMIAGAGTAGYFRAIEEAREKGLEFPAYIANSQQWLAAGSVTAGIKAVEGEQVPPELLVPDEIVETDNIKDQFDPSQQENQQMNQLFDTELQNEIAKQASN